jgi:hypothetical protein
MRLFKLVFLIGIANIVFILVHIEAFQSSIPWLSWLTIAIHIYLIAWFIFIQIKK